jgi:hypothetical protein
MNSLLARATAVLPYLALVGERYSAAGYIQRPADKAKGKRVIYPIQNRSALLAALGRPMRSLG